MIQPDRLSALMDQTSQEVAHKGPLVWQRAEDWTRIEKTSGDSSRGGGLAEAVNDDALRDRIDDRRAGAYQAELDTLTKRIVADLTRLQVILTDCSRTRADTLGSRDLLAAQAGAAGWCVSCWRNDQTLTPIDTRPSGQAYYRDLCRFCGQWKAEHGQVPPMAILKMRHDGRRITVAAAAKIKR